VHVNPHPKRIVNHLRAFSQTRSADSEGRIHIPPPVLGNINVYHLVNKPRAAPGTVVGGAASRATQLLSDSLPDLSCFGSLTHETRTDGYTFVIWRSTTHPSIIGR